MLVWALLLSVLFAHVKENPPEIFCIVVLPEKPLATQEHENDGDFRVKLRWFAPNSKALSREGNTYGRGSAQLSRVQGSPYGVVTRNMRVSWFRGPGHLTDKLSLAPVNDNIRMSNVSSIYLTPATANHVQAIQLKQ